MLNRIYLLIVILICLTVFNCKSQNLIANGSFENHTGIDCVYGGFWDATSSTYPYPHVVDNWEGTQTSDYFNSVCTNTYCGVPVNYFGYCPAKQGTAYVGIAIYQKGTEVREYIYQHLISPLLAGQVYCLTFYVSRSERSTYAVKNIEAYFSSSLPSGPTGYFNGAPQIVKQTNFVTDTMQWTQVQGCFTALGGEQYITIGNFNSTVYTDTLFIGTNNPIPFYGDYSYYYFDDISLINQTSVGIREKNTEYDFKIYPNPNTGLLKFSNLQYSNGDYTVKILDLFGKEIINEVLKEELDISFVDKGVYTLLLYKNKQLVVTKKVMKD